MSCEAFDSGVPRLSIVPREVRFTDVPAGTTVTREILLTNQGLDTLHITSITAGASNSAQILRDSAVTAPATLAPGAQGIVTLRFEAAGAPANHEASWTFTTDDPVQDVGHFTIRARGNVVAAGAPPPLPGPGGGGGGAGGGTPPWVPIAMGGVLDALGSGLRQG